jgi:hypothetical protein
MIKMKPMVKHSTLIFGLIAALGLALLTFFLTAVYLARTYSSEILIIEALVPSSILGNFWVLFLIVGTGFLIVGILGIGRQRIKNKRTLFTVLTAALTPIIVFTLFLSVVLVTTYPGLSAPSERMAITSVSVTATNPLILSLNAKSFYMAEIWFDNAYIKDRNQTTVASIIGEMVEVQNSTNNPANWPGHSYWTFQYAARLPAASDKVLTLDFNTTLPSGEYSVWLHSYRQGTFITNYFNIP